MTFICIVFPQIMDNIYCGLQNAQINIKKKYMFLWGGKRLLCLGWRKKKKVRYFGNVDGVFWQTAVNSWERQRDEGYRGGDIFKEEANFSVYFGVWKQKLRSHIISVP